MEILTNESQETWETGRVKELTMSRIATKNPRQTNKHRSLVAIVSCVALFLTISITAYTMDAFGVRSFFSYYWTGSEDSETIELNVADTRFRFGGGHHGEIEFESIAISPTRVSFSLTYTSNDIEPSKPWTSFLLVMTDNTIVSVDMINYSVDGELFIGFGNISPAVNLDDVAEVGIWRCDGELGYSVSTIAVHSGDFDAYINRARHKAMHEFLEGLRGGPIISEAE